MVTFEKELKSSVPLKNINLVPPFTKIDKQDPKPMKVRYPPVLMPPQPSGYIKASKHNLL